MPRQKETWWALRQKFANFQESQLERETEYTWQPTTLQIVQHKRSQEDPTQTLTSTFKMRFLSATSIVAGLSLVGSVIGHNIQLKAHSRECFHEELHRGDKMTVTFQVGDREFGGAANLDIDFFVSGIGTLPNNPNAATDSRTYRQL